MLCVTMHRTNQTMRIPLKLVDVADLMQEVEFKVFAGPAKDPEGRIVALRVPGAGSLPRSQIDEYTKFVGHLRCKRFGVHQSKRA